MLNRLRDLQKVLNDFSLYVTVARGSVKEPRERRSRELFYRLRLNFAEHTAANH